MWGIRQARQQWAAAGAAAAAAVLLHICCVCLLAAGVKGCVQFRQEPSPGAQGMGVLGLWCRVG